jgi:lysophospholipase L1-like esterase
MTTTTTTANGPSLRAKVLAVIGGVCAALLVAELGLRAVGFQYRLIPQVQFGWPDPVALSTAYRADRDLIWVPKDYDTSIALAQRVHPAVIFMGDSCTEFGTYASKTMALIKSGSVAGTSGPMADFNGVKLGVGGWSSEQGRVQLLRDVIPLHPRVITVYYGWNDHWIALGPTDPDLLIMRRFLWLSDHSRLLQAVLKARIGASVSQSARPNRVSLERYRANLDTIVRDARQANIVTVLITAPSNHVQGHEPEYLAKRHVRKLDELVPLHRAYVDATRAAAKDTGAVLCDAAAAFEALPAPHDVYFQKDGIHLTDDGDRQMAAVVAPCVTNALRSSAEQTTSR